MSDSILAALIGFVGRIGSAILNKVKPQQNGNHINNTQIVIGKGKTKSKIENASSTSNVNNKQVVLGSGKSTFSSK